MLEPAMSVVSGVEIDTIMRVEFINYKMESVELVMDQDFDIFQSSFNMIQSVFDPMVSCLFRERRDHEYHAGTFYFHSNEALLASFHSNQGILARSNQAYHHVRLITRIPKMYSLSYLWAEIEVKTS